MSYAKRLTEKELQAERPRDCPPIPDAVRQEVMRRAQETCDGCEDCWGPGPLELHHLHYRTVGEETADDLLALCRRCHKERHALMSGAWCNDPEEVIEDKLSFDGPWVLSDKAPKFQ